MKMLLKKDYIFSGFEFFKNALKKGIGDEV
jgi:hypothetical protein